MLKTIQNLAAAFAGESQARNRYDLYAKIAKKEGLNQIAEIFKETAKHEAQHAKQIFIMISSLKQKCTEDCKEIKIEAAVPTTLSSTASNLQAAIAGETYETTTMYPEFATIAEQEGLSEIAVKLRAIAVAENYHKERFEKLALALTEGKVLQKSREISWVCSKCGYRHSGKSPVDICPSCAHEGRYFFPEVLI